MKGSQIRTSTSYNRPANRLNALRYDGTNAEPHRPTEDCDVSTLRRCRHRAPRLALTVESKSIYQLRLPLVEIG